jgi:hypothetical protein
MPTLFLYDLRCTHCGWVNDCVEYQNLFNRLEKDIRAKYLCDACILEMYGERRAI